jgi:transposase
MENLQGRHDLTDNQWTRIEPIIKARLGTWGGSNANDNRTFVNGVLWHVRTGSPWRDIPPQYGKYNAIHRRYKRWCDEGHWDYILEELIDDPDYGWLMIDASFCKVHPHAAGAVGGNQEMERTKGGLTPKFTLRLMELVCRSKSLSQKVQQQIANLQKN